jgi:hypothetical protein
MKSNRRAASLRTDDNGQLQVGVGIIAFVVLLAIGLSIADSAVRSSTINESSQFYEPISNAGENSNNVINMTWMYYLGAAGFGVLALFMKLH